VLDDAGACKCASGLVALLSGRADRHFVGDVALGKFRPWR